MLGRHRAQDGAEIAFDGCEAMEDAELGGVVRDNVFSEDPRQGREVLSTGKGNGQSILNPLTPALRRRSKLYLGI